MIIYSIIYLKLHSKAFAKFLQLFANNELPENTANSRQTSRIHRMYNCVQYTSLGRYIHETTRYRIKQSKINAERGLLQT